MTHVKGMTHGKPVVIGMDYIISGHEYHNALALSASDPLFTAEQFGTIAVHLLVKLAEKSHAKDPLSKAMMGLLHEAYNKLHTASEKKLHAAMKANGLE